MKKSVERKASSLNEKVREYVGRKTQRELTRLLGRSGQKPLRVRNGSVLRAPRYWQKWEVELVGKFSDAEVVRRTGRAYSSVQSKREKMGILYMRQRDWTENEISLLGKFSDREVARMTQRTWVAVQTKRHRLKISPLACNQRAWSKKEDALLGKHSDRENARRLGRSFGSVQHRRKRLGIPKPDPLALPWTKLENSLLGAFPDSLLCRYLGRTLAAVQFRRNHKGIPRCTRPPDELPSVIAKLSPALRRVRFEKGAALATVVKTGHYRRRGKSKDSTPRKQRWWTAAEDKLLGKFSDQELARRFRRSEISVQHRRLRLGIFIPGCAAPWTADEDALVGTMTDQELAQKLNRTLAAVKTRRQHKGIAPLRRQWR